MVGNVVMRCSMESVILVEIDDSGSILSAQSYGIKFDSERNSTEEWLQAFAKAVAQIPKKIRQKITLIVPTNTEIFIKHIKIPDLTEKSANEAFRFECEHEFPGGAEEWSWDVYRARNQTTHAFGIAIHKIFLERIIDILISNKIQFSYICPEILLNTTAIQNCVDSSTDSMLAHIGRTSSYLSCIGDGIEYFRTLPITVSDLTKTIAESQKLPTARAETMQLEFLQNPEGENRAFMTYYIKQFAQKLRQEFKKSELFYCRTFKQNPTTKLYLTGSRGKLYDFFKSEENTEVVDVFDALKSYIAATMKEDEVQLIKSNIGTFVGAAYCLKQKQTKLLSLFAADFSHQVEFQRQHFGYLLIAVALTLATLTGLKILKKDITNLETQKAALEAKLFEINVDGARYEELKQERTELHSFIKNAKLSLYSQSAWIELFNELQKKLETLETAWIESMAWADKKDGANADKIEISAKMLIVDNGKKHANGKIEGFISSLADIVAVERVENIRILSQDEHILSFSFAVILKKQSELLAK